MREQAGGAGPHEQTRGCARTEELVTFLYGEAEPPAARDFQTHLQTCAACREELAAFGAVRARVGEWRAEGLDDAPSLGLSATFAPASAAHAAPAARVRSARAALRAFFALSPLWLRAGACAALLLVCGLSALTLARTEIRWGDGGLAFKAGVPERAVERIEARAPGTFNAEQVEALVRERVRAELAAALRAEEESAAKAAEANRARPAPRLEEAASAPRRRRNAPRATPRPRPQSEDEESPPRLSDLLSGVY